MNEQRKDLIKLLLWYQKHNLGEEVVRQMTKDGIYPPQTDAQFLAVEAIIIPVLSKQQREIIEHRKKVDNPDIIIPGFQ